MEFLVDGLNLTKTAKKKLDKLNKINIHLHGKEHSDWPLFPKHWICDVCT
jgi:glutaredoxin-related protein